jgi:hypothetical protein
LQLQRIGAFFVKTATFPSLRVSPELREAAETVLHEGETLSSFIEASVKETIERRRVRAEFIARGLASREQARRTGVYHDAAAVRAELAGMLAATKTKLTAKAKPRRAGR